MTRSPRLDHNANGSHYCNDCHKVIILFDDDMHTIADCAGLTETIIAEAAELGRDAGEAVASWVFDGNTDRATYERFLQGLEDGDPETLDRLPSAPLSGEWADGPTPTSLLRDLGIEPYTDDADALQDAICDAFEEAYDTAMYEEVERVARYHTEGGGS